MAHQHKFVIPVEWQNTNLQWLYKGDGSGAKPVWLGAFVTKLRCVCGEEVERNG